MTGDSPHPIPNAADELGGTARPSGSTAGLQFFLFLDMCIRMFVWSSALAVAAGVLTWLNAWPEGRFFRGTFAEAWVWTRGLGNFVLAFNLAYVAVLIGIRLLIPTPRPGVYATGRSLNPLNARSRQLIWCCLLATLTKARYEAPFPAFFVFHISNLPPMRWLMGPIFGPRSRSCYISDPLILDPAFVEIGRNVVIGSHASIAGHVQVQGMVQIRRTIIEDDVLIGANAVIFGGVRIGRGAMIAAGSVVPPYTTVGPFEYWSGVPAVKIRRLPAATTVS